MTTKTWDSLDLEMKKKKKNKQTNYKFVIRTIQIKREENVHCIQYLSNSLGAADVKLHRTKVQGFLVLFVDRVTEAEIKLLAQDRTVNVIYLNSKT